MTSSNIAQLSSQEGGEDPVGGAAEDLAIETASANNHVDQLVKSMVSRASKAPNYIADKLAIDAITMTLVGQKTSELDQRMHHVREVVAPLIVDNNSVAKGISNGK